MGLKTFDRKFGRELLRDHYPEYIGTALRLFGESAVRASVVFWPDVNNRFPWEPDCQSTGQDPVLAIV